MISRNPANSQQPSDHGAAAAKAEERGADDFLPKKNAAKRKGVTRIDVARMETVAKLEGRPVLPTASVELATKINVCDAVGSHRKQAEAKLVALQRPPQPSAATTKGAKGQQAGALHEGLAALERAVQAFAQEQQAQQAPRKPTR